MPLRLRRGTNAERLTITPLEGELIYVTDTKKVFVGDGNTIGGTVISSSSSGGAVDSDLDLNNYNIIGTGSINITGNVSATGLVGNGTLVLKGNSIASLDTVTSPDTGNIIGTLNLSTTTDYLQVVRQWADPLLPIESQYGLVSPTSSLITSKFGSRGSFTFPSAILPNDCIAITTHSGYDGTGYAFSSAIWHGVDPNDSVAPGIVPGQIQFVVNGEEALQIGGFNSKGYFGIRKSTDPIREALDINGNAIIDGQVTAAAFRGTFVSDDSTLLIDGASQLVSNGVLALINNELVSYDTVLSPGLGTPIGRLNISTENNQVKIIRKFVDSLEPLEEQYGITNAFSSLVTAKFSSRGSLTIPTSVFSGDNITRIDSYGYDGFDYVYSSSIWQGVDPSETVEPGYVPGAVAFVVEGPFGQRILGMNSKGYLGINKFPEPITEALDVVGNGVFTGNVSAAAFKGSLFADDSTTIVDAINGSVYASQLTASMGSIGAISFDSNVISTSDSSNITVTNETHFNSDVTIDGRITAGSFSSESIGPVTLESATDLTLKAGAAVIIKDAPLRIAGFTNTERNLIFPENGDLIYNKTVHSYQSYQNGTWEDIFTAQDTFKGTVVADDSTILVDGISGKIVGDIQNNEVITDTLKGPSNTTLNIESQNSNPIEIGYQIPAPARIYIGSAGNTTVELYSKNVKIVTTNVPTSSKGQDGDSINMIAVDDTNLYFCKGNYDGVTDIWVKTAWTGGTW